MNYANNGTFHLPGGREIQNQGDQDAATSNTQFAEANLGVDGNPAYQLFPNHS